MINKKKWLTLPLLTLSAVWSISSFAAPVTWQLSFFDESGKSVGNGEFSYDPNTTTCIYTDPQGCNGTIEEDFDVQTKVESSSIDLAGFDWGTGTHRPLQATIAWWADPVANVLPGTMGHGKAGVTLEDDTWRFQSFSTYQPARSSYDYTENLFISEFTEVSETFWTGNWLEYHALDTFVDEHDQYRDTSISKGSFSAEIINNTAVPIPGGLWLFFSGLFAIVFRTNKNKK